MFPNNAKFGSGELKSYLARILPVAAAILIIVFILYSPLPVYRRIAEMTKTIVWPAAAIWIAFFVERILKIIFVEKADMKQGSDIINNTPPAKYNGRKISLK